jgi:hypothetical protein
LAELEGDLAKRAIVAGRQNKVGLVDSIASIESGADIAGAVAMSAFTGNPMWLGLAVRGIGAKAAGSIIKGINSPDANIARMFKNVEKLRAIPTRKIITPTEAVERPIMGRGAVSEANIVPEEAMGLPAPAVAKQIEGQPSRLQIENKSAEGQGFKSGSPIPMRTQIIRTPDVIELPVPKKQINTKKESTPVLSKKVAGTVLGGTAVGMASESEAGQVSNDDKLKAVLGEAEDQGIDGMRMLASALNNRGKTQGVFGVRNPRNAIFAPTVRHTAREVKGNMPPRISIRAVVFAYCSPLSFR